MKDKRYIGTFQNEKALLDKIKAMKAQGIDEDDMYVVVNNEDKVSMVRGQTDVELTSPEHTGWMQKFKSYFTGEEPVREALSGMGFTDEEADRYYREAERGGMLLFADQDELHHGGAGNKTATDRTTTSPVDSNIGGGDPNLRQRVGAEAMLDRDTDRDQGLDADHRMKKEHGLHGLHRDHEHGLHKDHHLFGKAHDRDHAKDDDAHLTMGSNRTDAEMEVMNEELGSDEIKPFNSGVGEDVNKRPEAGLDTRTGRNDRVDTDLGADTTKPFGKDAGLTSRKTDTLGNRDDEQKLRLHEERLDVDKNKVETGEVNVNKHVETEKQRMDIPVTREEVEVERRPVNETVDPTLNTARDGKIFDDGEDIHIPVRQEKVEVTKKPVVDEEIVVKKKEVQDTEHIDETVRREKADINRTGDTNEANLKNNKRRNDDEPLV